VIFTKIRVIKSVDIVESMYYSGIIYNNEGL